MRGTEEKNEMAKLTIIVATTTIAVGTSSLPVRADEVPTYDVAKSCRVDVQAYQGNENRAGCMTDEQNARTTLVAQWTQFTPDARSRCTKIVGDAGDPQSYVELLTCLQMAKDVKTLPK